jgi:Ca2+-binding RTX toxin-like protein
MGTYTGTSIGDTITPYEVSAGVISVPAGSMPSSASDTINGLDGNDDLDGGGSGDIINGGAGDDRIDDGVSGSGQTNHSNTIHGNDGADDILLRIADSGGTNIATNSAYGDAGNDIVSIYYDWGWDTYDDWLGQPPTGSLLLRGGEGNDELGIFCGPDLWIDTSGTTSKIYGDAGNDFLWATALDPNADLSYYPGNNVDTLYGGTGNDKFFVLEAKDVVIENVGEGTDTIIVDQTDYTLPTNVENLTMTYNMQDYPDPDSGWRGTGNALANVITGCDLADTLDGAAGNDTIKGMDGDDTVYGGLNNDTVYGGDGNDWLNGQWGNDIVYGDAGYDTIIGEDGNDKLFGGNDNDWFTAGAGNWGASGFVETFGCG